MQRLLDAGAAVDLADADGENALTMAASEGHAAVVQLLLARGADHAHASKFGSALAQARAAGHSTVAQLLEAAL